jgi:hypothetical protein
MDSNSLAEKTQTANRQTVTPTPDPTLSPGLSLNPENDRDLRSVLDAWPMLPGDVKRTILHAVKATLGSVQI